MTVRDLIDQLMQYGMDLEVHISDNDRSLTYNGDFEVSDFEPDNSTWAVDIGIAGREAGDN